MFNQATFQELRPVAASDRLLAVVRCDDVTVLASGSRSERHNFRTTMLHASAIASAAIDVTKPLLLSHYAQGVAAMARNQVYLIAAYRESTADPLNVVEAIAVDPATAQEALQNAERNAAQDWQP